MYLIYISHIPCLLNLSRFLLSETCSLYMQNIHMAIKWQIHDSHKYILRTGANEIMYSQTSPALKICPLIHHVYSVVISFLDYLYIFGLSQTGTLNMPNINLVINNWTIHWGTSWDWGHPPNGIQRSQASPVLKMPPPLSMKSIILHIWNTFPPSDCPNHAF